jgi:hypothetical protein
MELLLQLVIGTDVIFVMMRVYGEVRMPAL